MLLLALPIALCAAQDVAEPAAATDWGDCLACHENPDPDLPKLSDLRPISLGNELGRSCNDCHEPADITLADPLWRHPLRSVGAHLACADCHAAVPHSAEQPPPRPGGDYLAQACYSCHSSVDAERHMFSSHGDSGGITCRACHPAHGATSTALPKPLLPLNVLTAREGLYDWRSSNSDCLSCHTGGELFFTNDRGFTDSTLGNLHEIHLQGGETMCIECHNAHGSSRKAMLRQRLLTGQSMSFDERLSGGSCAVTCHGVEHQRLAYDGGKMFSEEDN